MPGAEREVAVAEPMAVFIAGLPPRTVRMLRLALRALEWLPFPRRFSRLSLESREGRLARMERSRFAPLRDLLLLAKLLALMGWARDVRVQAVVGAEAHCAVAEGSPAPTTPALGELEPAGDGESCDVAIVGSGAGGAAAAAVLAEAGLDVVVLEQGPHLDHRSYPSDPLEALPLLYRDAGLTIATGRPAIPVPVGRAVGGTTVINSGTCFRAPGKVLEDWRDRVGVGWACSLDDEYDEAERMLKVAPVETETMGRNGALCMEGARALGASGGPIARNAGRCVQCSSCPLGCPTDAKRAMHVSYLPRAVAAGARVRAGVEALAVQVEEGRATGVICRAGGPVSAAEAGAAKGARSPRADRPWRLRARTVIVAAGAFGTPELLQRSGLSSPHLGRHLHVHPAAWIGARYEREVRGWEGIMQSYYVDEWEPRRILLEATFTPLSFGGHWLPGVGRELVGRIRDYGRIASIGVHLHDRSEGRVGRARDGSLRLSYRLRRDDADDLLFGIARAAEIHFAAGATEVYPNVSGLPTIERGRLAEFEAMRLRPADLRLEAFHPMSTARMSAEPGGGATAPDGSVRGVEELFVCDASLLPTSVGVNPMMTIIACSARIARGIAERQPTRERPPMPAGGRPGSSPASA